MSNNANLIRGLLNFLELNPSEHMHGERYHTKYWTIILNNKNVSFKNASSIHILELSRIKIKIKDDAILINCKADIRLRFLIEVPNKK